MPSVQVNTCSSALGGSFGAAYAQPGRLAHMEELADRIRRLRTRRGLSQAALASLMGIKPASVAEWELGDSRPAMHRLPKLAAVLGVSVTALVQGTHTEEDARREELVGILPRLEGEALDVLLRMAKQLARAA